MVIRTSSDVMKMENVGFHRNHLASVNLGSGIRTFCFVFVFSFCCSTPTIHFVCCVTKYRVCYSLRGHARGTKAVYCYLVRLSSIPNALAHKVSFPWTLAFKKLHLWQSVQGRWGIRKEGWS
ncbi:hypothetical protein NPIL_209811 [Nephila pilipes]|uniref:Uncharacterized protein n=1 Tax=Nephila pilipes TaxID=299642 RepID=A0A8X6TYA4_NEPPI|nr:hypothetical protein NPIL_209811 [Nephila pilipes]